jgi:8-hydroxy-5-deazaflavin:NADPH oxidoreductase
VSTCPADSYVHRVDKVGSSIPILALRDAVASADAVINALPGSSALATLQEIGAEALAGKILVDVANALSESFTLIYPNDSLEATLQAAFPWNADSQFDLGDISTARATEHYIFLSASILTALNTTTYGIKVVR